MTTTNYLKTTLLLGGMTGLVVLCGGLLGGRVGMGLALILAAGMNFGSYWFSDKIVLTRYRAKPVRESDAPRLHAMLDRLCIRARLPKPKLYLLPERAPNAFATGRSPGHAAVAVTAGMLETMDQEEVEGILAHELAHIQNRDILISSVAATIAGAITLLAVFARFGALFGGFGDRDQRGVGILGVLVTAIVAPIAALVIQMAVSRSREFAADASGARIAGTPRGLARALKKLGQSSERVPLSASPTTSHMFIVTPLSVGGLGNLFRTHPPIEERVRRLLAG